MSAKICPRCGKHQGPVASPALPGEEAWWCTCELDDAQKPNCLWTEEALWHGEATGSYATNCGENFAFVEGGIEENGFIYCPFCGGKVDENPPQV